MNCQKSMDVSLLVTATSQISVCPLCTVIYTVLNQKKKTPGSNPPPPFSAFHIKAYECRAVSAVLLHAG